MMNLAKEKEDSGVDHNSLYPKLKKVEDVIMLNVGGARHEVLFKNLQKFPDSRLGNLSSSTIEEQAINNCNESSQLRNELYFDRNPIIFNAILDFYRTGKLHFNDEICAISLCDELEFWIIAEENLSPCCKDKYFVKKLQAIRETKEDKQTEENDQSCGWNLLENPSSSIPARMYYLVSLFFVLLNLLAMTLNTVPSLLDYDANGYQVDNPHLLLIQLICLVFVTLEFVLRFLFSPNKCQFLKGWMNILDFLAILPFFSSLAVVSQLDTQATSGYDEYGNQDDEYGNQDDEYGNQSIAGYNVDILLLLLNMLKVFWIFKLVRYSTGLQTVFSVLGGSMKEFFLLTQVLVVGVFFFGSLTYYAEAEEADTGFNSMPQAFWFALVTMTTVGYGDISPYTGLGKTIASFCAIFGVLIMVLPIAVIAINFARFYNEKKEKKKTDEYEKVSRNIGKA